MEHVDSKSVIFLGNSQSTWADLSNNMKYSTSFISLLDNHLKKYGIFSMKYTVSSFSIDMLDNQFFEIMGANNPKIAVMQFGIIECARRILPKHWRIFLKEYRLGRKLTFALHDNHYKWLEFCNKFGFYFQDVPLEQYSFHADCICSKLRQSDIAGCFIAIPLLSDICLEQRLPDTNKFIVEYNNALIEICLRHDIKVVDIQQDYINSGKNLEDFFVGNTVHLSEDGHKAAFVALKPELERLLNIGVHG